MIMTRRERLTKTLQGQPVDRPAVSFYEIGGFLVDPEDPDEFNIYNSPDWKRLLDLAWSHTDLIRMCSAVRTSSHENTSQEQINSDSIRNQFFSTRQYRNDNSEFQETQLKIGGRAMRSFSRRDKGLDTVWQIEHLLKDEADARAFLQLPNEVFNEIIEINKLFREERKIGDRGIVMVDTEDPICAVASLFSMETFTILAMTENKLMHSLLEKMSRHIYLRTEKVAREFPGRLWRIYGPEFVSEPFLPPRYFEEYVVRYTGPMVKMIQKHGGFVRIHSHGRLKNILDYIVGMGVDALDPIEPPPQGDVELSYVREKYGRQLVLFGNLEITDLENTEPDQFEKIVEKAIQQGTADAGRGFVLMPSASPYGRRIPARTMRNYEIMIEKITGAAYNPHDASSGGNPGQTASKTNIITYESACKNKT